MKMKCIRYKNVNYCCFLTCNVISLMPFLHGSWKYVTGIRELGFDTPDELNYA